MHAFSIETGAAHAYLGWHGGLRVISVSTEGNLTPVGELDAGDHVEHMRPGMRRSRLHGNTLWLDRMWPRQTLEVDVSTPSQPKVVAVHSRYVRQVYSRAEGFYYKNQQGVALYDVADPWPLPVPTLTLPRKGGRWYTSAVELRDGRAYALMDDQFAVFELPERD